MTEYYHTLFDELREVADWFRLRGLDENAAMLDHAEASRQKLQGERQ